MDQHNHVTETAVVTRSERQPAPLVDAAAGATYKGYAPLGTPEDAPGWLITKTSTTGTVTRVEYAFGSQAFNQRWSQRTLLAYAR